PTPSRDDLAMTAQVGEATAILSIALRDHVIVGNGRWVSFRQEGLL
ncbi:JAB domain-containing protein, partial [Citrobacter freundii]